MRALTRIPLVESSPLTRYRDAVEERWERHADFTLYSEGTRHPDANLAIVYGPVKPDDLLAAAERFFGESPCAVLVESGTGAPVEDYLRAEGWLLDEEETGMVLTPIPEIPPLSTSLIIRRVTMSQQYEDFMRVVPGNRSWIPSLEAATDPRVALFVGYVGDEPVAASRLTCFGNVVEVLGVTTLEGWRRRGFGEALTWAALREGQRRGCDVAILTATEMGYPLYRRMGFIDVCSYRVYVPPGIE